MSMKRTRQKSFGSTRRGSDSHVSFNKQAKAEKSWDEQIGGQPDEAFVAYDMKSKYAAGTLLQHATFGKGIVTAVEDQRIEVLFQDTRRKLGHGLG